MKRRVPAATYYEVSNCGHCPHHEAPEVVNQLMARWMSAVETGTAPPEEPVVAGSSIHLRSFAGIDSTRLNSRGAQLRCVCVRGPYGEMTFGGEG